MTIHKKFFLAAIVTLVSPCSAARLFPFQHFFPNRGNALTDLVNGTCLKEFDALKIGQRSNVTDAKYGYWGQGDPGWAVTNCLLENALESVKADFSSAQVLLGLMPSILGVLGPSSQELSLLLVLGNRQILAFCLALGSPFTNTIHSFDFAQEIKTLPRLGGGRGSYVHFEWQAGVLFLYFEYVAALAAIVNIAELSYEFARNSSSTIVKNVPNYLPGMMVAIGFAMHLLVAFTFQLCATIKDISTGEPSQASAMSPSGLKRWVSRQLLSTNEDRSRYVELNTAQLPYTMTSWFAKIAIFTHFGLSVMAFSTVLFVSSEDAVILFFRYFASVCVCRLIAANEIAVLGAIMHRAAKTQDQQVSTYTSIGSKSVIGSKGAIGSTGGFDHRDEDGDNVPLVPVRRRSGEDER